MIYVYLDAENVSEAEAENAISAINGLAEGEPIVGKFYGMREQLGSLWEKCLDFGYEYVDTTDLSAVKKNCTDIKICVDAFSDVFTPQVTNNERCTISKIFIISKDTDFLPLVRKMRGFGLSVEIPLFKKNRTKVTLQDVTDGLHEAGWNPMDKGAAILDSQFGTIKKLLGNAYSDELVASYLQKKYLKFLHSMLPINDSAASLMNELDARTFNFWQLKKYNFSKSEMRIFINLYTSKCFGFTFPKKVLSEVVTEVFA